MHLTTGKLSDFFKEVILLHLQKITLNNESWFSFFVEDFIEKKESKNDQHYITLVKELKEMIKCNEPWAKKNLGDSFNFFNAIEIVTIDLRANVVNKISSMEKLAEVLKQHMELLNKFPLGKKEPINGTAVKSEKDLHIDLVGHTYETFKDLLRDLFAEMQPNPLGTASSVNAKIENIYRQLTNLRDLACKHLPV